MKNERLNNLKNDLDFVELDQRLEMIKIPALSELACNNDGTCPDVEINFSCPKAPEPAPAETIN